MNIADNITFEGVEDLPGLISRLELFKLSLINQMRKEPTVFHADPAKDTKLVQGAKPGDLAIWTDEAGVDHYKILGG